MSKKINILGVSLVLLGGVSFVLYFVNPGPVLPPQEKGIISAESATTTPKSAEVRDTTVTQHYTESAFLVIGDRRVTLGFNNNEILYDVLMRYENQRLIDIKGKDFDGLGYFVQSIDNLVPKKGESLILYVNGKKASVGVSSITPKSGDVFEFKIEDNY